MLLSLVEICFEIQKSKGCYVLWERATSVHQTYIEYTDNRMLAALQTQFIK